MNIKQVMDIEREAHKRGRQEKEDEILEITKEYVKALYGVEIELKQLKETKSK